MPLHAMLNSTVLVALSEMGDKTQLLTFTLTSRFRRPWIVLLGVTIATLLNHGIAASLGGLVARFLTPGVMGWLLVASFFGFALWTLKPDTLDEVGPDRKQWGPLVTTIVLFFIAEMGDKTQLATIALGAKYPSTLQVIAGTTLGMVLANALAAVAGDKLRDRVDFNLLRYVTAGLFLVQGVVTLVALLAPGRLPRLF